MTTVSISNTDMAQLRAAHAQLNTASMIAMLAVYYGILRGLDRIDPPGSNDVECPKGSRSLPRDLKSLRETAYTSKEALERKLGKQFILPVACEETAIKLIGQSTYLDDRMKDAARWFVATTPRSETERAVFVKWHQHLDTTGLEELEKDFRDIRGEFFTQTL